MAMNIINDTLKPDCFYHIFNRGINGCLIFTKEENYIFFLNRFAFYLSNYLEVYSYCLMPNHFHFLVKVKSEIEIERFVEAENFEKAPNEGLHSYNAIVSKQIGKFISSYSQSYNKVNNRHGALLESPFKRIKIDSDEYLKNVILYIHLNPLDINQNFETYRFSSYQAIVSELRTNIKRQDVIQVFGDLENFKYCHFHPPKLDYKF